MGQVVTEILRVKNLGSCITLANGLYSPVLLHRCDIYTVIHNYRNPYEKWNIFVAWTHLWLRLGMVKPEIMLCETVLNLSTLRIRYRTS